MAEKEKSKKGRPLSKVKVRGIKGLTPRGFRIHKINKDKLVFKKRSSLLIFLSIFTIFLLASVSATTISDATSIFSGNINLGSNSINLNDWILDTDGENFRIRNQTMDIMSFNATADEWVFPTNVKILGFTEGGSPLKLREGVQFFNVAGIKGFSIYHAHGTEEWRNISDIFEHSVVFELDEKDNPYGMDWVMWDKLTQRPPLVINFGAEGRATTFDRSLRIGKANSPVDENFTMCTNLACNSSDAADLEVEGSIWSGRNISATYFIGDGSQLTGISGGDSTSSALGTHIIEGPANTDIIEKDPGDATKIRTKAAFKLRTVVVTDGVATIQSIISIPAGVEVTNTIPPFSGGWLGVRDNGGTYEFFSKEERLDFDTATESPLGRADRTATDITAIVSLPELGFGYANTLYDFLASTGLSKRLSGGDLEAIPGTKTLKRHEGVWWRTFANRDENNPHKMTNTENNPVTSYEIHSSTGDVEILTEMEVGFIDDGAGGKTAIDPDEWSFYIAYHWARHTGVGFEGFQRSTRSFISLHEARALTGQGIPERHSALDAAVPTHIIFIKGDATDLDDSEQASIEWIRKDNLGSSGDPEVGALQQSGVIDWVGTNILTINVVDPTKFDRGEFRIGLVDRETGVKFTRTVPAVTNITVNNLATDPYTYYGYNIDTDSGIQQSAPMVRTTLDNIIPIGRLWHRNKTVIDAAQTMPLVTETSHDYAGQLLAFGALKQSGLSLSADGANKKVDLSTGVLEVLGGTATSRNIINTAQPNSATPLSFTPVHRAVTTGNVVFEAVTDDPNYDVYDDGSGTLATLSSQNFGIHYFYIFPYVTTTDVFLIRGDESYSNLDDAQTGLQQNPIPIPSDFNNGFPFAAIIAKKGTTDLQAAITAGDAVIAPADRFGSFGAVGGGGGGTTLWGKSGTDLSPAVAGDDILLNIGETLSITDMTEGSIPFIGTSGLFTQDNSNLFWNDANNRLTTTHLNVTSNFTVGNERMVVDNIITALKSPSLNHNLVVDNTGAFYDGAEILTVSTGADTDKLISPNGLKNLTLTDADLVYFDGTRERFDFTYIHSKLFSPDGDYVSLDDYSFIYNDGARHRLEINEFVSALISQNGIQTLMVDNSGAFYNNEEILTVGNVNVSKWNTAYGWGDHDGLYSLLNHKEDTLYSPNDLNNLTINNTGTYVIGNFTVDGDVGIRTTTPYERGLTIGGYSPRLYLHDTNSAPENNLWDITADSDTLLFRAINDNNTIGSPFLEVTRTGYIIDRVNFPNGNVGIGTSTPSSTLEVNGTVKINNNLNMTSNNITAVDCITFISGGKICNSL